MTKDKARKRAARERAAQTGERYVVALRASEQATARLDGVLHRLTHRVPGVPAHVEGGLAIRHNAPHARRVHRTRTHHRPAHHLRRSAPRVLVGWQTRIARFFGSD